MLETKVVLNKDIKDYKKLYEKMGEALKVYESIIFLESFDGKRDIDGNRLYRTTFFGTEKLGYIRDVEYKLNEMITEFVTSVDKGEES